jgi:hypothetical protein
VKSRITDIGLTLIVDQVLDADAIGAAGGRKGALAVFTSPIENRSSLTMPKGRTVENLYQPALEIRRIAAAMLRPIRV